MSAFQDLVRKLAHKKHPPKNVKATVAAIGRKKLGQREMTRRSVAGRRKK